MPPRADSLLNYDNPVLVTKRPDKSSKDQPLKLRPQQMPWTMPPPPQPPKTAADDANEEQTKQLLHAILPPRLWIEDNKLWVQQVSTIPSTRMDVVHLQEQLDRKLEMKQGRKTGICPIRRDLYSQCFDELIRQNTISCAERGLLLLRVRNEIMMTIAAYQTLYESSIAYGMRKALQAELSKSNMKTKMSDLENEKKDLERQLRELKSVHAAYEEDEAARWQVEETKHSDALKSVTRSNQQLRAQLESIFAAKLVCVAPSEDGEVMLQPPPQ